MRLIKAQICFHLKVDPGRHLFAVDGEVVSDKAVAANFVGKHLQLRSNRSGDEDSSSSSDFLCAPTFTARLDFTDPATGGSALRDVVRMVVDAPRAPSRAAADDAMPPALLTSGGGAPTIEVARLMDRACWTHFPRPLPMRNWGNSCFFSAAWQCLARVGALTEFCLGPHFTKALRSGGSVARAHRALLVTACSVRGARELDPIDLRRAIAPRFAALRGIAQQDAHELLLILLDALHDDLGGPIEDLFWARTEGTTTCTRCGFRQSNEEPLVTLGVSVQPSGHTRLENCMTAFARDELLDGDDRWMCPTCRQKVPAWRRMWISKPPPVLIIHLKRFTARGAKIRTAVELPPTMIVAGVKMELQAVIHHTGNCAGGHYTADVRSPTDEWRDFDDSIVRSTSPQSVRNAETCYVLFYERSKFPVAGSKG